MQGTHHSVSPSETRAYCEFINKQLGCSLNPSTDELFTAVSGGVLLVDLLGKLSAESAGLIGRMKTSAAPRNKFEVLVNHKAVLDTAALLKCSLTNIGPEDLFSGTPYLVLGLVWQLIRFGLLSAVSVEKHPELAALKRAEEDLQSFVQVGAEANLLRWVNYHLSRSAYGKQVSNFGSDLQDSMAYLYLLNQLNPAACSLAALQLPDPLARAAQVVDNARQHLGPGRSLFVEAGDIVAANDKLNLAFVATLFNHMPQLQSSSAAQSQGPSAAELEAAVRARHAAEDAERERLAAELARRTAQWQEEERAKREFLDSEAAKMAKERAELERQKEEWARQQKEAQDREQWERFRREQELARQREAEAEAQRRLMEATLKAQQADQQLLRMYQTMTQWVVAEYGSPDPSERVILQEWFHSVDQDSSGLIDQQELSLAFQAAGERFEPSMVLRLFHIFDESGLQKISFDAFCILFRFITSMRTAFQTADIASRGILDIHQLEFALSSARLKFELPNTLPLLFAVFDRSKRRGLSFENFLELTVTIASCRKVFQSKITVTSPPAAYGAYGPSTAGPYGAASAYGTPPPTPGGYGAPAGYGGYGAPPPTPAAAAAYGGYGGYGAPPSTAGGYGGYGAPSPATAGGYGAAPQLGGAGSYGGSIYGAPPPTAAGGYGAPPPTGAAGSYSGSMYGAPPATAGAYGAPPSPAGAGAGAYGAPPSPAGAGAGAYGAPPTLGIPGGPRTSISVNMSQLVELLLEVAPPTTTTTTPAPSSASSYSRPTVTAAPADRLSRFRRR